MTGSGANSDQARKQARLDRLRDGLRGSGLLIAIWGIVIAGSLLNLLNHNEYPLFRAEIAVVLAGVALIAAVMGVIHRRAQPHLSFLITGALLVTAIDLNTSLDKAWVFGLWIAATALAFFFDRVILKLLGAAFASVAIFQLSGLMIASVGTRDAVAASVSPADRVASDRPAIVHIIFDSYLGMDGMAHDPDTFGRLRQDNLDLWQRHGFTVYDGAYTRHANTVNSIPQALSYGTWPLPSDAPDAQYVSPQELPYFTDLAQRDYRIHSTMPDYVDLCRNQPVDSCNLFRRSDLSAIARTQMPMLERAETIGNALTSMSRLASAMYLAGQTVRSKIDGQAPRRLYSKAKLFPVASLDGLAQFKGSLANIQAGEVRFAHALLPHDPYMLQADCTIKPFETWQDEHEFQGRDRRDAAYRDQVRCAMRQMEEVMAILNRSEAGRNAIVIVHGDHGSRITHIRPRTDAPPASTRDYAMTYSTLLAMRVPGEPARNIPGTIALDDFFAAFAARDFAGLPQVEPAPATVTLTDGDWIPRREVSLPEFGPAALTEH